MKQNKDKFGIVRIGTTGRTSMTLHFDSMEGLMVFQQWLNQRAGSEPEKNHD